MKPYGCEKFKKIILVRCVFLNENTEDTKYFSVNFSDQNIQERYIKNIINVI